MVIVFRTAVLLAGGRRTFAGGAGSGAGGPTDEKARKTFLKALANESKHQIQDALGDFRKADKQDPGIACPEEDRRVTWPQYRDGGFTGQVSQVFSVHAIPQTFTVDPDGVLQDQHIGDASIEGKLKRLVSQAEKLQTTKSPWPTDRQ